MNWIFNKRSSLLSFSCSWKRKRMKNYKFNWKFRCPLQHFRMDLMYCNFPFFVGSIEFGNFISRKDLISVSPPITLNIFWIHVIFRPLLYVKGALNREMLVFRIHALVCRYFKFIIQKKIWLASRYILHSLCVMGRWELLDFMFQRTGHVKQTLFRFIAEFHRSLAKP